MYKKLVYALMIIFLLMPVTSYSASDAPIKTQKKVVPNTSPECHKSKIEEKINTIESACIENNQTQSGMNDCASKSYDAWDKALNEVYNKLIKKLDKRGQLALKTSQKEWLKYRDVHFNFLDIYYEKYEGSMYTGMHINDKTVIVKDRTMALHSLLELMEL